MNLVNGIQRPQEGIKQFAWKVKNGSGRVWRTYKKQSKKRKLFLLAAILLIMLLICTGIAVFAGKDVNLQVTQAAKAVKGTISNTVAGTGNLELGSSTDISIPSGITVEEVLVESGDKVSKGDTLAKVNSTTVLKALAQTQEVISDVDSQISASKGETESPTITAGVAGRVKQIYAANGDAVLESMSQNNALMLLSLDGKMAVTINKADDLTAGDTVSVILSDGASKKTGTVESISNGTAIITITDNGPGLNEKVTIKKDGSTIGTGKLYIHSQLAVVGTGGTIKAVKVSENQSVSAGTTLYTLKDMPASAAYQGLLAQRQELAEVLSTLVAMAQTNTITASASGTIENVNVAAGSTGSGSESSEASTSETSGSANAVRTSAATINTVSAPAAQNSTDTREDTAVWDDSQADQSTVKTSTAGVSDITSITSVNVPVTAPVKGALPQSQLPSTTQYTGNISWNMKTEKFQADSTYTARITLKAASGCQFTQATDVSVGASGAVVSGVSIDGAGEGNTMTFTVTFTKTEKDSEKSESNASPQKEETSSTTSGKSGSEPSEGTGTSGSSRTVSGGSAAVSGGAASSGSSASSDSSAGSDKSSSSSAVEIETVAAFSLCSDEEMVLPISVDELDILSIEKGQKAKITFDAIEGQSYTGEITRVSNAATINGGVAKYSVEITIPADDSMRVGMNGSATVTINSKKDILLIPINALQESGERTFVYTKENSDGTLSGEKEVEIGISDGENVEITSGLSEGDTIYYIRTGALSQNNSPGSMPGGGGFGKGDNNGGAMEPPTGGQGSRSSGSAPDRQ